MRLHYYQFPEGTPAEILREYCGEDNCDLAKGTGLICGGSISGIKKLLRQYGGAAWTEHCERDGNVFEVTPITLKGNNSQFRYNRHL